MELGCTKKLLEYLGVKPEKGFAEIDPLFAWTANLMVVNRRKVLVAVHGATRCAFVLYGLTAKMLPRLPELIHDGIRGLLQREYVRPEIIERYLDDLGREVVYRANSDRKTVAGCNKVCQRIKMLPELFEAGYAAQVIHPGWNETDGWENAQVLDSTKITLREIFVSRKQIVYEYDFGDGWMHTIELCHVIGDCTEPYPHCVMAIGEAPMEDCGGPDGFRQVLVVLKDKKHPDHQETLEWIRFDLVETVGCGADQYDDTE